MAEFIPDSQEQKGPLAQPQFTPDSQITNAAPPSNPFTSPKGFYGPGVVSNLLSRVTGRSPQEVYDYTTPKLEGASQVAASLAAPAAMGSNIIGRLATQGAISAGSAGLAGKSPLEVAGHGALGMTGQGLGELAGGAVRLGANSVMGPLAQKAAAAATKKGIEDTDLLNARRANDVKLTNASNKVLTDTLNKMEREQFEKAAAAHAEEAADKIIKDFDAQIPAFAGMRGGAKGLADRIYGEGPARVSAAYEKAMQEAMQGARGTKINIAPDVARAFNLASEAPPGVSAQVAELLRAAGKDVPTGDAVVDAADLIKAMTGQSSKNREAYRAAVNALTDKGVGTQEARQAYSAAQALFDYIDKTKGLKGEKLNPESILGGMTDRKTIDLLRRRGQGDINTGPMQAARGGPLAPTPMEYPPKIGAPDKVPYPAPVEANVREMNIPWYARGAAGAGLGMAMGGGGHYGLPGLLGAAAGHALIPSKVVTRAPLTPAMEQSIQTLPGLLAQMARLGIIGGPTQPER